MNGSNLPGQSRRSRATSWLAAAAIVALAGVGAASAAAGAAGSGTAAAAKAPQPYGGAAFKQPKLVNGALTVKGTNADDEITLRLQTGDPSVLQIDVGDDGSAEFSVARAEITNIAVSARAGDDVVRLDDGNGPVTAGLTTTLAGGAGDDVLGGGAGTERLLGGPGDDTIDGNGGADTGVLGAGDDTFVWDPGDGSDVVEGQEGADAMRFNGAGGAEQVDLSANGKRLRFFRTQGSITMDTASVERIDFNALGGADLVTVNDLSGTDVVEVMIDLAGALSGVAGDGQSDRVVVNGTDGDDAITVAGNAGLVEVSGLYATVAVLHSEAANDRLEINSLAGADAVDSGGLAAGAIQLLIDGVPVP